MNQCILTGNLGDDPQTFYSSEGNPIVTFSLAFRSSKDKTNWVKVVCFNKTAEVAEKYLHKGAKVLVSATLDQKKWETEDGQQRSTFQLIANQIEFIKTDGRGFEKGQRNDGDPPF
jgi:single-strand DNA-binding protein